tara:strand:+ start:1323 stop:1697 length:375 start_codon:yes stop_codon:yes gene_type:complete
MNKEEIVRELAQGWVEKDEAVFRKHMSADFHFKGPMMESHGLDEMFASMEACPFESSCQNSELVIQGDNVVNVFDWVVTKPFLATIPCVEVMAFDGNKVKKSRLFFDTAQLPKEFVEQMMKIAA